MKFARVCALQMSENLNEIDLEIIENREVVWVLLARVMGIVEDARGILLGEELAEELEAAPSARPVAREMA